MTAYAAVLSVMNRLNEALHCNPIEVGDCASEYLVFVSHYNKSEFPQDRDTLESVFLAANQDDFLANNSFLEHDKVTLLWMCLSNFLYHQTKLEDFKRIQNFMRSDVEAFLKAPPLLSGNDGMHITKYANDIEALFEWFISNNKTIPHSLFYKIEKGFLCLKRSGIMQSECATTCTNDFATLVRRCHEACLILPEEIWEMKQLRHLYFKKCSRLPVPGKRMTWPLPMPDAFPPNLKQLTLQGCHRPWKEMWVLSALPKLEVLKLKDYAFKGSEWQLTDEEVFFRLKVLLIDIVDLEQWEASSINFPKLQSLVLKYCTHLREIPIGFGEIYTLQSIELWECNSSTYDSVDRIREEQENSGNDGLIVRIHRGHNGK
nr:putative late blight resistance protein homolog R1B-14 [Ipomoea batatas]